MKQKMYEKPSVEVVKLQTSVAMLAGSPTKGQKNGYDTENDLGTWGDPEDQEDPEEPKSSISIYSRRQ